MQPTFAITDAKGNDHEYTVRPVPVGAFADWAVEIEHQETGAIYRISETRGYWSCTCKAFECSKPPKKSCKHVRAVEEWRAIAEALATCLPARTAVR